jgi:hypothetical protein
MKLLNTCIVYSRLAKLRLTELLPRYCTVCLGFEIRIGASELERRLPSNPFSERRAGEPSVGQREEPAEIEKEKGIAQDCCEVRSRERRI